MPSVGAVTSNLNVVSKTANYTAVANDFVLADATSGAVQITLPAAPVKNTLVAIKKTDGTTSAVSVVPSGTAKVDNDSAAILAVANASITVQFDGTDWRMLSTAEVNTASAIAGLPIGGSSNQVLTKNTGSNFDVKWTSPTIGGGGNFPLWATGSGASRLYCSPYVPSNTSNGTNWGSSYSVLNWFPMQIPNPCSITNVYVWSGAPGATGTMGIGIYADAPGAASGGPGLRLASAQIAHGGGSGQLYGASIAWTFTAPQTVWIAYGGSTALSLYSTQNNVPIGIIPSTVAFVNGTSYPATTPPNMRYSNTWNYTNMPGDVSTFSTTLGQAPNPIVLFTVA